MLITDGMTKKERLLLVLDLDETLIFSTESPLERPADFRAYQYHCYKRPGLDKFLRDVAQWHDLAIWSSASDPYVLAVAQEIIPLEIKLEFVWGRSRATLPRSSDPYVEYDIAHREYVKTLAKIKKKGWPLSRILIVDDTPEKSRRNYGNAIYPKIYEGRMDDDELLKLAMYLKILKSCPDVRSIEKRGWRQIVENMRI